jgi:hypothetical protein
MISALLYLQWHSTWNRLVTRLKRLKKPKYLVGFIVGGLYCYFYFFRFLFGRRRAAGVPGFEVTAEILSTLELIGALVLFVLVLGAWVFPHARAALTFSEAEVLFLFPAPLSRRTLIHFKLLKSQFGILFTTLIMSLLSNRFGHSGSGWAHLAGWWLILSLLNLHFLGASFARSHLLDLGITNWRRRGIIFLLLALAAGAVAFWARRTMAPPTERDFADLRAMADYLKNLLESGPALFLLYPFRVVVQPFLAQNAATFLQVLWPVLGLLVLHFVWVVRSNVAFEEASLALAQKRAEHIASIRQGQLGPMKRRRKRDPFSLAPVGPPAVALLWKNLIAAGSAFTVRMVAVLAIVMLTPALVFSLNVRRSNVWADLLPAFGMFLLMGLAFTLLIGPQIVRQDFRSDLRVVDMLKLYPLAGWRVVLGELLAPAAILTVIQWILLLLAMVLVTRIPGGPALPLPTRLSVGLGAAIIFPILNVVSLLIPNAAVLIFPAFFQSGQDMTQGIEATGQRLIFFFGQVLVLAVALVPAAAMFALVLFLGQLAFNWVTVVPLAALAAVLILCVEAGIGIGLLGKVFDKFDVSVEPQT